MNALKRSAGKRILEEWKAFHNDEQGDEGVNKILIIALIAIPLVILLILFGKDIVGWFKNAWNNLTNEGGAT